MSERFADFKKAIDDMVAAQDTWQKTKGQDIDRLATENTVMRDRIEELESRARSPGKTAGGDPAQSRQEREHKAAFLKWLRRPNDHGLKNQLAQAEGQLEQKDVLIGSDSQGGYAVPGEISRRIEQRVLQLNPFRQIPCRTELIGSSKFTALVDMHDDAAAWVGETDTRTATAAAQFRARVPTGGTVYSLPRASEEAIDDIFFNVERWLVDTASDTFAAAEATAIISGDGSDKPTGFLNTTPTTADDVAASPFRDAGTLQYFSASASPLGLMAEDLIALPHTLKEKYLLGGGVAWLMNRTTLARVRQLKDGSGRFVWAESLAAGVPGTLCGFPVYTCDAMPSAGQSPASFPIVFGNWQRGYLLCDRLGLRVVPDPYSTPGYVRFYIRRRVYGCVLNCDALKVLRF